MADSDHSFVSRWSRRKQAGRPETAEQDKLPVVPEAPDGGEAVPRETTASDELVAALRAIVQEAEQDPEKVKGAPHKTRVGRLDEAGAARKPRLRWSPV